MIFNTKEIISKACGFKLELKRFMEEVEYVFHFGTNSLVVYSQFKLMEGKIESIW